MITENNGYPGLYRPQFEHDSCGIGFVANLKGRKNHQIIEDALAMLSRMEHRGGTGCDLTCGDGAGILMQVPHSFFTEECAKLGFKLPSFGEYGVGMVFFPQDEGQREECRSILEHNMELLGLELIGYREVPVDNSMIGKEPKDAQPQIEQVFIKRPDDLDEDALERKLYVLRNYTNRICRETVNKIGDNFYIISMSYKTILFKGQLTTEQVRQFFLDLPDERMQSSLALVHSRFSTNTFPSWRLAQPFRYVAHNGEINTVRGNVNWMKAREALLESTVFTKEELDMILPVTDEFGSDSSNLDMVVELLVLSGRPIEQVMMMIVPEAWQHHNQMSELKKSFYEYYACIMEPWDGPASLCFTDGKVVGATLDRNGLRPSRYLVTKDDVLIMASESGVIDVDPATVITRGRLQPGKMFIADLNEGRIVSDDEVKEKICSQQPYGEWLKQYKIELSSLPEPQEEIHQPDSESILHKQQAFGYSTEDLRTILKPMAEDGKEPLGSMGSDTPLAVLSNQSQHLSSYFKQLFAQVTNPPIDPIRERTVMSLHTYIGPSKNILTESAEHCHRVQLPHPVLSNKELEKIKHIDHSHFQTKTLDMLFKADGTEEALKKGVERICRYSVDAVEEGYSIILLSDRSINSDHAAIPSLLAVGAVHHHLIKKGLRAKADIVIEAGDVRETHHFATLIGYGASAINPYLAIESLIHMRNTGLIDKDFSDDKLFDNYAKAINGGLLKIFSKMGISTLQSYQGAQIFEALGISSKVVSKYFTGTVSRIEGVGLEEIAKEVIIKHQMGFPEMPVPNSRLDVGGVYQWKQRGEKHLFNPETIHLLQNSTKNADYDEFQKYAKAVDEQAQQAYTLRGLLKFKSNRPSISIDEVESAEKIYKRFATGAMSFGSISWEAHTTLAIAMNRLGGKSNSGEGGEDPIRFEKDENGDWKRSAIKQVASGRFGVTSYYLANADELQIKMAQGAKPGEGGQLPGHKVDDWIGRTRGSTPGVGLISPPPHHDIYSIEDLAQLIYDLKNSNRDARVNVKLVSEAGVGTIATGVCKAKADVVLIAGFDGGTGASPLSSIKHTGLPWELGVAETHQTLVKNKLRDRIVVQADGQMKTPRDLAIATLLGAEEWGVATAALVVEGCIMMRKCHLNTCPVGIATQNKTLRERFNGKVEHVVTFFEYLTQGLREIMAELGFKSIDEMVGQSDCLEFRKDVDHWKYNKLDLSPILYKETEGEEAGLYCKDTQNHQLDEILDWKLLEASKAAIESGEKVSAEFPIININRTLGAMLSNEISKKYKGEGLPEDTIRIKLNGSAGQSFGVFLAKGVTFELEGDANDYFGKGLSGGKLVVYPDKKAPFDPKKNIVIGNVAFYGATNGESYIRGVAGERFCVRNSGAHVVVEGVGDHGCEYMTGGTAVILGPTGRNFAAGMSGGEAYIYDPENKFPELCNMEMVDLDPMDQEDLDKLKRMIENHKASTGSDVAAGILDNWEAAQKQFVKVMPRDYKRVLLARKQEAQKEEVVNG